MSELLEEGLDDLLPMEKPVVLWRIWEKRGVVPLQFNDLQPGAPPSNHVEYYKTSLNRDLNLLTGFYIILKIRNTVHQICDYLKFIIYIQKKNK